MPAGRVEVVMLVDAGELWLVHDGVAPFARVAEGMGVVPISDLPRGGRYAGVGGVRLARFDHSGLVQEVGVLAHCPLHRAALVPSSAVAVGVSGQLLLKPLVLCCWLQ